MTDIKFWLPLAITLVGWIAVGYGSYVLTDYRLSQVEKVSDAEEIGAYRARLESLERQTAAQWRAIRGR